MSSLKCCAENSCSSLLCWRLVQGWIHDHVRSSVDLGTILATECENESYSPEWDWAVSFPLRWLISRWGSYAGGKKYCTSMLFRRAGQSYPSKPSPTSKNNAFSSSFRTALMERRAGAHSKRSVWLIPRFKWSVNSCFCATPKNCCTKGP